MFKNLLGCFETLWHKIANKRTVILVTAPSSVQLQLRILSIQERWHILFARTLEAALQHTSLNKGVVVLYESRIARR
jgi:hypothetical protein